MSSKINNGLLQLVCNFDILWILAYTFWNLGFRIQLIENTSILLFFVVSLLLPLVVHIMGIADWMQIRALTLLFLIIINMGIAYGSGSILPIYNKVGYNKTQDENDPITLLFRNQPMKIFLIVATFLCLFVLIIKQMK